LGAEVYFWLFTDKADGGMLVALLLSQLVLQLVFLYQMKRWADSK
jgi:hypothetical protein